MGEGLFAPRRGRAGAVILAVGASALWGCALFEDTPTPSQAMTVEDHADPLTEDGYDNLFVIHWETDVESYPASQLQVRTEITPGEESELLDCEHDDADEDGDLTEDETLTCSEGAVSYYDDSLVGEQITVQLLLQSGSRLDVKEQAHWVPDN